MRKRILMVGESPEDIVHGISVANQMIWNALDNNVVWLKERNSFGNGILRRLGKLPNFFAILLTISFGKAKFDYFYTSLAVSLVGLLKSVLITRIAALRGMKVFVHIHRGDFVEKLYSPSKSYRYLSSILFKTVDTCIVLSESQKQSLSNFYFGNIQAIPNTAQVEGVRRIFSASAVRFIYLSNLIEAKGYRDLVEVFRNLNYPNIRLDLFGEYSTTGDRIYASSFSGSSWIQFHGPVYGNQKYASIENSDCFILPSYNEGQPISILEAMSRGLIVVATKVGVIDEMLPEGYPFLYEPGDLKRLGEIIQTISVLSVEQLNEISTNIHKKYLSSFSQANFEYKIKELFQCQQ